MTKVSLRAYNREIEGLVEQGHRLDEAVAHCRHILSIYPKHLDTYRLLGKAYLEAKRYDQAVDIFQRVLVAVPEDFVSHVGMSIIADDQGKLDEAIWHMERAFEVQPSNAAIQAELQRLFGRRDGVEPPKIRLTRGALAHMYVQGELYTQAISEIRTVLAHDQNRPDLQVLLARAYFRNGQKAEAAEVCAALLAISPYCLDANRLMAASAGAGQPTDATREYYRRVSELDPYAEFAQGAVFATDSVADGAVSLQRLDYSGQPAEGASALETRIETNWGAADSSASPPKWLMSEPDVRSPLESTLKESEDVPDFIREAGWREVNIDRSDEVGTGSESEPAALPGALPEWVRALAPTDESQPETTESASGWQAVAWTGEMGGAPSSASMRSEQAGERDSSADWLKDLAPLVEEPAETELQRQNELGMDAPAGPEKADVPGKSTPDHDDALAWLEGLAEKHGAKPEELLTTPEQRMNTPPDWIESAGQVAGMASEGWRPIREAESPRPEEAPAEMLPAAPQQDEKPLDWLSGLSDQNTFAESEEQIGTDQEPSVEDLDVGSSMSPEREIVNGALPDWLGRSEPPAGGSEPAIKRETSGEYESAVDLPEWLAGLDSQNPSAPTVSPHEAPSEKLPDWLQDYEGQASPEPMGSSAPEGQEMEAVEATNAPGAPGDALGLQPLDESGPAYQPPQPGALPVKTRPVAATTALIIPSLGRARTELGRGNIAAALDVYDRLIRKGKSLEEIIRDLRDALYRYPVEVPIWQALGDAYMRANRLQDALDAYTKAEELLR